MSKKSKLRSQITAIRELTDDAEAVLDETPSVEHAGIFEDPPRKELEVYVVELNYGNQTELVRYVLDQIGPGVDDIDRETKEVLRLWVASNGCILGLAPPPAGYLTAGFGPEYGKRAVDEHAIYLLELSEQGVRRCLDSHGVI